MVWILRCAIGQINGELTKTLADLENSNLPLGKYRIRIFIVH